ncbi:MAG: sigma 54-interacting transcriptional regulator [Syntrophomonas sp.]
MKMESLSLESLQAIETVLNGFDGAVIIDSQGRVLVCSERYAEAVRIPQADIVGKHILDVFPDSKMLEVVKTGRPIYIDLWNTGYETVFVSRYPISCEGRIIGAIGLSVFRYLDEAKRFAKSVTNISRELLYYKSQLLKLSGAKYSFDTILGSSSAITAAKNSALPMVKARTPVLILGETGTGKELFAHAIHQAGPRRDRPFIRVNCASIPENLVESELFGYEEGAFSGARKGGKPGKFELANGGTIFLDEINELPYGVQAKLLRVLQEGEIDHVGGTELSYVDVRVLSATSADLTQLIKEKRFREDFYYRISAFQLTVPPLRDRDEDIPLLGEHFINYSNYELGTSVDKVGEEVLTAFAAYNWPGNVRELRNVIQRCCLMAGSGIIRLHHLPPEFAMDIDPEVMLDERLDLVVNRAEKEQILKVLSQVAGNRNKAAQILGVNRTQLYRKMKKHDLI